MDYPVLEVDGVTLAYFEILRAFGILNTVRCIVLHREKDQANKTFPEVYHIYITKFSNSG